jgi:hypothetical protein
MIDLGLLPVLTGIALLGATADTSLAGDRPPAPRNHLRLTLTSEETRALDSARGGGRGGKWLEYGLIGACAGGVSGAVIGYFASTETCSDSFDVGPGCETDRHTLAGGLIGAGIGAVGGVLIGMREDHLNAR